MEKTIASLSLEQLQRKAREIIEIPLWDVVSVAGGGRDGTTGGSAADDSGGASFRSDRDDAAVRYYCNARLLCSSCALPPATPTPPSTLNMPHTCCQGRSCASFG